MSSRLVTEQFTPDTASSQNFARIHLQRLRSESDKLRVEVDNLAWRLRPEDDGDADLHALRAQSDALSTEVQALEERFGNEKGNGSSLLEVVNCILQNKKLPTFQPEADHDVAELAAQQPSPISDSETSYASTPISRIRKVSDIESQGPSSPRTDGSTSCKQHSNTSTGSMSPSADEITSITPTLSQYDESDGTGSEKGMHSPGDALRADVPEEMYVPTPRWLSPPAEEVTTTASKVDLQGSSFAALKPCGLGADLYSKDPFKEFADLSLTPFKEFAENSPLQHASQPFRAILSAVPAARPRSAEIKHDFDQLAGDVFCPDKDSCAQFLELPTFGGAETVLEEDLVANPDEDFPANTSEGLDLPLRQPPESSPLRKGIRAALVEAEAARTRALNAIARTPRYHHSSRQGLPDSVTKSASAMRRKTRSLTSLQMPIVHREVTPLEPLEPLLPEPPLTARVQGQPASVDIAGPSPLTARLAGERSPPYFQAHLPVRQNFEWSKHGTRVQDVSQPCATEGLRNEDYEFDRRTELVLQQAKNTLQAARVVSLGHECDYSRDCIATRGAAGGLVKSVPSVNRSESPMDMMRRTTPRYVQNLSLPSKKEGLTGHSVSVESFAPTPRTHPVQCNKLGTHSGALPLTARRFHDATSCCSYDTRHFPCSSPRISPRQAVSLTPRVPYPLQMGTHGHF